MWFLVYAGLFLIFYLFYFFEERGRKIRRGVPKHCMYCPYLKRIRSYYNQAYTRYRIAYSCCEEQCPDGYTTLFTANRSDAEWNRIKENL